MAHRLYLGADDGSVHFATSPAYDQQLQLDQHAGRSVIAVSPANDVAVGWNATGDAFRVYRSTDLGRIAGLPTLPNVTAVAWSPNGTFLAIGQSVSPWLRVYALPTWAPITLTSPIAAAVDALAWSPDSAQLALGGAASPWLAILHSADWSAAPAPPIASGAVRVSSVTYDPSGGQLAIFERRSGTSFAKVFRMSDGGLLATVNISTGLQYEDAKAVAYSPDGLLLAICDNRSTGRLLNTTNWTQLYAYETTQGTPYPATAAFAPDGSCVVFAGTWSSTSGQLTLRVIDTADFAVLSIPVTLRFFSLAFSSDDAAPTRRGILLDYGGAAVSGGSVSVIDRRTFTRISTAVANPVGEFVLNVYGDGDYLIAARDPRTDRAVDALVPARIDSSTAALDPLRLYLPTADQSQSIGNVATRGADGGPVDAVVIRHWESRRVVAIATPDEDGAWSADLPPGKYDISYLSDGCLPVCHGPYTVLPA